MIDGDQTNEGGESYTEENLCGEKKTYNQTKQHTQR